MTPTQRTVEEASKYILESIEDWKNKGQLKKIISLSNWAEKWRSKIGEETANMKQLFRNIRDLKRVIQGNKKIDPNADVRVLEREVEILSKAYSNIETKRGIRKTVEKIEKNKKNSDKLETL